MHFVILFYTIYIHPVLYTNDLSAILFQQVIIQYLGTYVAMAIAIHEHKNDRGITEETLFLLSLPVLGRDIHFKF